MGKRNSLEEMITVVIPILNKAATVGDVITHASKCTSDILVVDGHSQDNTVSIARSLGARVIFDHEKGKGDAIRTAIPYIKRGITVFVDADGSYYLDDIPSLVEPIFENMADHVSGSRKQQISK